MNPSHLLRRTIPIFSLGILLWVRTHLNLENWSTIWQKSYRSYYSYSQNLHTFTSKTQNSILMYIEKIIWYIWSRNYSSYYKSLCKKYFNGIQWERIRTKIYEVTYPKYVSWCKLFSHTTFETFSQAWRIFILVWCMIF